MVQTRVLSFSKRRRRLSCCGCGVMWKARIGLEVTIVRKRPEPKAKDEYVGVDGRMWMTIREGITEVTL